MNDTRIIFIVGLTGVGKSTTLQVLAASGRSLDLLPNRRELADTIIIPAMQRSEGISAVPVKDRLERFRLTGLYRQHHPAGMLHALEQYLNVHPPATTTGLVFDNLRGVNEVQHAVETFPHARFIMLDAPPLVRLQRLTGRCDAFDTVTGGSAHPDLTAALEDIEGLEQVFSLDDLVALAAGSEIPTESIADAARIIVTESRNYDSQKARAYLQDHLDDTRLLYLDTSTLTIAEVTRAIGAWV